jgi:hypothetical protein
LLRCWPLGELPTVLLEQSGSLSVALFASLPAEIERAPKYLFQRQKTSSGSHEWCCDSVVKKVIRGSDQLVKADRPMVVSNFGFEYDDGSAMEWNEVDNFLSLAIRQRYRRAGIRIGVAEKQPYLIERLKIGLEEEPHPQTEARLHARNLEFTPFDSEWSNVFCVMKIENSQLGLNRIHVLIFNSQHRAVELLKTALEAANERMVSLEPLMAGRIRDAFQDLPVIGFIHQYTPGLLEPRIVAWVRAFCFAVADAGVMNLVEKERAYLRGLSRSSVIPCYE